MMLASMVGMALGQNAPIILENKQPDDGMVFTAGGEAHQISYLDREFAPTDGKFLILKLTNNKLKIRSCRHISKTLENVFVEKYQEINSKLSQNSIKYLSKFLISNFCYIISEKSRSIPA